MKDELKKLGLTEGESKAYISLLKLGSSTVGPIVNNSKVSYSKIYMVLNRLIEKGFVSYIIKNKTRYYQAVKPNRIIDYLNKKQQDLESNIKLFNKILPSLEKINDINEEEAQIFVGFDGIKTAYEELIKDFDKKEELMYFYVYEEKDVERANLFYSQEFHYFKELGLKLKGISTDSFKKSKHFKKTPSFVELRFVNFPLPSTMDIYKNKVLMIAWHEKPVAYLINSKEISENYRKYFNDIWKIAKK